MTACPTSVGLGLIEGKIGIRDQLIDSRAIVWRDGYARAPSKVKRVITDWTELWAAPDIHQLNLTPPRPP